MVRINREQWPQLVWLFALGLLGVILLLAGSLPAKQKGRSSPPEPAAAVTLDDGLVAAEETLELRLKTILAQICGAGAVEVRITLAKGPLYDFAVNTNTSDRRTEETDDGGSKRITTEKGAEEQVVMRQSGGSQEPVVIRQSRPEVQGVLVLAQGAGDPLVRARLSQAVQTLLGIAPHQVAVLPME